jgi:2-polyprenyl-6-methoxyphenol hydroxylase-like FAD-dependent oxidoreductase
VLREHVRDTFGVDVRDGAVVDGLVVDDGDGRGSVPRRVSGVRIAGGDAVAADLVVDATGPRGATAAWLRAADVEEPAAQVHPSGIVYLSRFYELRDGHDVPAGAGPIAADLGYLKYAVFVGDNRTFSITLAVDVDDTELRRAITTTEGFEAAAAQLDAAQPWRDGRSRPITGVELMAGLQNRKRTFVVDGEPIVVGYAAVGDAAICTNPLYGRGCSLALVHAYALADALAEHADDPRELALAFHDATERELEPWFRAAVLQDLESTELRGPAPPVTDADGTVNPRAWARAVFRDGLLPAIRTSPVVFRAFLRWFNLLATPDALINDPEVMQAALASYADRANHPTPEPLGPTREAFLANLRRDGT